MDRLVSKAFSIKCSFALRSVYVIVVVIFLTYSKLKYRSQVFE